MIASLCCCDKASGLGAHPDSEGEGDVSYMSCTHYKSILHTLKVNPARTKRFIRIDCVFLSGLAVFYQNWLCFYQD